MNCSFITLSCLCVRSENARRHMAMTVQVADLEVSLVNCGLKLEYR
jgi:hypothetical protein